ncbi:MAG: zinc ribbon domain-containing protein [Candidatus Omnitrophica bacterium]|nr:zinc ribbon domain-containing protein [Candidatus Omnitrophota bacterium]
MAYHFICSHCGKKFELETPTAKECPFCYWSSSVKREEEHLEESKRGKGAKDPRAVPGTQGREASRQGLGRLFKTILILALAVVAVAAAFWVFKNKISAPPGPQRSVEIPFSGKESPSAVKPAPMTGPGIAALTPEEKEALYQEVTLSATRVPDPSEQEVLGRVVRLETGWVEKLPSGGWTLEQYTRMIEDQERFYKITFPRSYKKKLLELFTTQYLPGVEAFAKGELLAARDLWVGSLGFPLYAEDLRKHRAVALTMLRPFINDTLAKVRAVNQSLVDRESRGREEALSVSYQAVTGLIVRKDWDEALKATSALIPQVVQLQESAKAHAPPPPYPASFAGIDADLQPALMELMSINPLSLADLQPLLRDLTEKKEILETFTADYTQKVMTAYRQALALVHDQKWEEAMRALSAMAGPPALREDAARKVSILRKITGTSGPAASK